MAALGCLVPVLLGLGGVIVGAWLGGNQGALWGGLAGFVLGSAVPILSIVALARSKR